MALPGGCLGDELTIKTAAFLRVYLTHQLTAGLVVLRFSFGKEIHFEKVLSYFKYYSDR